ncbi:MAG: ribosomal biogenesis protein [Thermoplasmata archaeon]|nr:ribosomal biogenesis protein [Thermoplasmata archaeon]
MAILVTKWFGCFLVDEKSCRILDKRLMPKDAQAAAEKLALMQRGGILDEERELVEGVEKPSVSDRRQSALGKPMMFDSSFIKAQDYGFEDAFMHEVMVGLGRLRTSEPVPRDRNLVQAIRSLDDQIATINLYSERLHEWYGMHFPELADYAHDERYAELIARFGDRDSVKEELGLDIESIGADMDDEDLRAVMDLADTLDRLYDDEARTEAYIQGIVEEGCPNMCAMLGGPLAARLVSLAGGLERLASLPSSTVQLLGAEKAMFRSMRSGKRGPKHGIIYQHPDVHRAPYWQRGKIARALAGKVLIAAKIDQYHGEFVGDRLNEEFRTRVAEIRKKYPDPPKKPQKSKGGNGRKRPQKGPRGQKRR